MKRAKYICATFYLFALLAFTGCASLVQVKAEKSGMQTLSAEIDLGEVITNAIKEASSGLSEINSSGGLDSNNELVIFDTKKIKSALENSEFKNAKISSPEFSKLNISGTGNLSSFAFQNEKSLKIKFSPENIKNLVMQTEYLLVLEILGFMVCRLMWQRPQKDAIAEREIIAVLP